MTSYSARHRDRSPRPYYPLLIRPLHNAGIGAEDIDLFEVQDTDCFCEIQIYEEPGLCASGEGGRLIEEGVTEIGGKSPVNVSGGLVSKGEPIGASHLGQVVEVAFDQCPGDSVNPKWGDQDDKAGSVTRLEE